MAQGGLICHTILYYINVDILRQTIMSFTVIFFIGISTSVSCLCLHSALLLFVQLNGYYCWLNLLVN